MEQQQQRIIMAQQQQQQQQMIMAEQQQQQQQQMLAQYQQHMLMQPHQQKQMAMAPRAAFFPQGPYQHGQSSLDVQPSMPDSLLQRAVKSIPVIGHFLTSTSTQSFPNSLTDVNGRPTMAPSQVVGSQSPVQGAPIPGNPTGVPTAILHPALDIPSSAPVPSLTNIPPPSSPVSTSSLPTSFKTLDKAQDYRNAIQTPFNSELSRQESVNQIPVDTSYTHFNPIPEAINKVVYQLIIGKAASIIQGAFNRGHPILSTTTPEYPHSSNGLTGYVEGKKNSFNGINSM